MLVRGEHQIASGSTWYPRPSLGDCGYLQCSGRSCGGALSADAGGGLRPKNAEGTALVGESLAEFGILFYGSWQAGPANV